MITNVRNGGTRHARMRDEARRRLTALAEHFAEPAEVLATARVLVAAGELETAHRVYRHGAKLGVDDPTVDVEHGEVLRRLGRRSEARALLEEAARRRRAQGDLRALAIVECGLGELYRDIGELRLAMAIAERWLTHREVWDIATFLWVDCVSLEGRSLERAVKLAVERGNASPAMFHALLQDLEPSIDPATAEAILAIGDETLFKGWLDVIPEMRSLAERLITGACAGARMAT
jgi:tetratricopeptide (TPR) repeat protein